MNNIKERIKAAGDTYEAYKKEYEAVSLLDCEFKKENRDSVLQKTGGTWIGAGQLGEENFVVYCKGEIVFADYILPDGGCYLETAAELFKTASPKSKQRKWFNLFWLVALRDMVRENYNHGIGLDDILYDEKPLTFARLLKVNRLIKEIDKYATIRS